MIDVIQGADFKDKIEVLNRFGFTNHDLFRKTINDIVSSSDVFYLSHSDVLCVVSGPPPFYDVVVQLSAKELDLRLLYGFNINKEGFLELIESINTHEERKNIETLRGDVKKYKELADPLIHNIINKLNNCLLSIPSKT